MRFIHPSAVCVASAVVVFGGCASAPAAKESAAESVCVRKREINSMGALGDDRHVFVKLSSNRHYLFGVDKACLGLRFAMGIAIADNATRVCGDGFSFLSFVDRNLGPTRCRVEWITPVEDKEAARALIEAIESEARESQ